MNLEDVQTLTREEAQAELDDLLNAPPQAPWDSQEAMLWRARKALLELWIVSNQSPTKKEPMNWILTASGRHFDYQNPTPDMIDLGDIATALSREARFNGHTHDFYSWPSTASWSAVSCPRPSRWKPSCTMPPRPT